MSCKLRNICFRKAIIILLWNFVMEVIFLNCLNLEKGLKRMKQGPFWFKFRKDLELLRNAKLFIGTSNLKTCSLIFQIIGQKIFLRSHKSFKNLRLRLIWKMKIWKFYSETLTLFIKKLMIMKRTRQTSSVQFYSLLQKWLKNKSTTPKLTFGA